MQRVATFKISMRLLRLLDASPRLPPGSWGSKTWTYPRTPHLWSAKDITERLVFFTAFLERLVGLLKQF